jgi:hypothetical protein
MSQDTLRNARAVSTAWNNNSIPSITLDSAVDIAMSKFYRDLDRIIRRSTLRPERLVDNLEQWERLATPEELTRLLGKDTVGKAA